MQKQKERKANKMETTWNDIPKEDSEKPVSFTETQAQLHKKRKPPLFKRLWHSKKFWWFVGITDLLIYLDLFHNGGGVITWLIFRLSGGY